VETLSGAALEALAVVVVELPAFAVVAVVVVVVVVVVVAASAVVVVCALVVVEDLIVVLDATFEVTEEALGVYVQVTEGNPAERYQFALGSPRHWPTVTEVP
jgi:hypothetical protein